MFTLGYDVRLKRGYEFILQALSIEVKHFFKPKYSVVQCLARKIYMIESSLFEKQFFFYPI
jgi:hypothetical protein